MSTHAGKEPVWLTATQVKLMQSEAIRLFGGLEGVRDEGLLESALGKPQHVWTYQERCTLFDLAAAYVSGTAKNHPFLDGNKRAALLAVRAFLFRNGFHFDPVQVETVTMMEGLAAGRVDTDTFASWTEKNSKPR